MRLGNMEKYQNKHFDSFNKPKRWINRLKCIGTVMKLIKCKMRPCVQWIFILTLSRDGLSHHHRWRIEAFLTHFCIQFFIRNFRIYRQKKDFFADMNYPYATVIRVYFGQKIYLLFPGELSSFTYIQSGHSSSLARGTLSDILTSSLRYTLWWVGCFQYAFWLVW